MAKFDWRKSVTYDDAAKKAFHAAAGRQLRRLAAELGFEKGSFDLRSNKAGPAVSGEITLHHEDLYVQVSQSSSGPERWVMIRTCEGRKDYSGGRNHFASIDWLDDDGLHLLASFGGQVLEQKRGFDGDARPAHYNPYYSVPTVAR
jgi:hypothetical protein